MSRLIVKHLAWFVLLIAVACLALTSASLCRWTHPWLSILNYCLASVNLILAWHPYRRMRRLAAEIDERDAYIERFIKSNNLALHMMNHTIKSLIDAKDKSKTQEQAQGQASHQDESEDEFAHPV